MSLPTSDLEGKSESSLSLSQDGQPAKNISDSWLEFSDVGKSPINHLDISDMFPMPVEAFPGDENSCLINLTRAPKHAAKF